MSIKLRSSVSLLAIALAAPITAYAGIPIVDRSLTETVVAFDIENVPGQNGLLRGKDCNFSVRTRIDEDDSFLGILFSVDTTLLDVYSAQCGTDVIELSGLTFPMKKPLKKGDLVNLVDFATR